MRLPKLRSTSAPLRLQPVQAQLISGCFHWYCSLVFLLLALNFTTTWPVPLRGAFLHHGNYSDRLQDCVIGSRIHPGFRVTFSVEIHKTHPQSEISMEECFSVDGLGRDSGQPGHWHFGLGISRGAGPSKVSRMHRNFFLFYCISFMGCY